MPHRFRQIRFIKHADTCFHERHTDDHAAVVSCHDSTCRQLCRVRSSRQATIGLYRDTAIIHARRRLSR